MNRSLPTAPLLSPLRWLPALLLALLLAAAVAVPARAQVNLDASFFQDIDRVEPGGTISLTGGVVAGSAEDPNDEDAPPYEVAFYLSEDAYLSEDDRELCRRASGGLANDEGEAFDCTVSLPTGLDEGAYWIIFSADDPDVVEEPFEPNFDESDNIQADFFTVSSATGGPDLDTAGTQLEDEEAEPGDRASIEYIVQNEGNADSGDFEVGYYFQPSSFFYFTPSEAVLAERETLGGVEAGEEEDESEQVTVPQNLPPDLYTVYVVLDDFGQISEEDETNNITGSGGLTILPTPGGTLPDLTVEGNVVSIYVDDPIVAPAVGPTADTAAIAYKLSNRGDGDLDASTVEVGYYLSEDSTFSEADDMRFGTTVVGVDDLPFDPEVPEEPGAEARIRDQKQLPAEDALPAGFGDYFVLIVADSDDAVSEADESNNTGAPQPRAVLRSVEVAAGETGTFSPPGADIGVSAEVTQNGDDTGGGHLLFRRLEGTAPQSSFDGSSAQAPDGTTLTPEHAAPVRWAITGSMLTETSFRPRIDTMGVPGIEDPDRLLVMGRKKPAEAWEPFDTDRTGSTLTGSERDPVWLVPSSVFTIGGEQSENPLPVELASFTATADDRAAVLEWQTASETNNDGFRIERRRPNADVGATGRSPGEWTRVAFVGSKAEGGTSQEPIRYSFRAKDLAYGAHTFRLVQTDLGGAKAPVGEPQSVEIGLSGAYALSEASPNPIRERASFELTVREAQDVSVSVYDALGRRVRVLHEGPMAAQETERLTLEAGGLASGVYFVRVVGEAFASTRRAVVVR